MSQRYNDHAEILAWLRDNAEKVAEDFAPEGRRVAGDWRWSPGSSHGTGYSVKLTGPKRGRYMPFSEAYNHSLDLIGFITEYFFGLPDTSENRIRAFDEVRSRYGIGNTPAGEPSPDPVDRRRRWQELRAERARKEAEEQQEQAQKREWARQRWLECQGLDDKPLPYLLDTRALYLQPWPKRLGFHPACPTSPPSDDKPNPPAPPALVAVIQGPARTEDGRVAPDAFLGLQRTYLSDDLRQKRDWEASKLSIGAVSGGLIHLTPAKHVGEHLGLCEGVENGLSLMMMLGDHIPIWAAPGTANLANAALPEHVRYLTIFGDWDAEKARPDGSTFRPGQQAAERAKAKHLAEGRRVRIVYPNTFNEGEDWNDWIVRDRKALLAGDITEKDLERDDREFAQLVAESEWTVPDHPPVEAVDPEQHMHWQTGDADPSAPHDPARGMALGEGYSLHDHEYDPRLEYYQRRYIYVRGQGFWDVEERSLVSVTALDEHHRHEMQPSGEDRSRPKLSTLLLNSPQTIKVTALTYWPGKPQIVIDMIDRAKRKCWNIWMSSGVEPDSSVSAQPFLDHLHRLFDGDERLVEHMLQYLAFLVQYPGRKVQWAPLIMGGQGIGKSFIKEAMEAILGFSNADTIEADHLSNRFNTWMMGKSLVTVEEMRQVEKMSLGEKLKGYITAHSLQIEPKGQNLMPMPNRLNFLFFSNQADAIQIDTDDRRFFVHKSGIQREPERMMDLYAWLRDEDATGQMHWTGAKAIAHHLLHEIDLSHFNPNAEPMMTQSKVELQHITLNEVEFALRAMADEDHWILRSDLCIGPQVTRELKNQGTVPDNAINARNVSRALQRLFGYEPLFEQPVRLYAAKPDSQTSSTARILCRARHEMYKHEPGYRLREIMERQQQQPRAERESDDEPEVYAGPWAPGD